VVLAALVGVADGCLQVESEFEEPVKSRLESYTVPAERVEQFN
jgi:hypothetical protein